MKIKNIIVWLVLMISLSATAQNRIDASGRAMLREYAQRSPHSMTAFANKGKRVTAIVTLSKNAPGNLQDTLGLEVINRRGERMLVSISLDSVEALSKLKGVSRVSFGSKVTAHLDKARVAASVDAMHNGVNLDGAYTGKGVVAGIMDSGVDPNHVAFSTADGTSSRVSRLWLYDGVDDYLITKVYDTPSEIASFTTDKSNNTHGTHVAAIMAGGYKGNNYYGVAPDADIVMGCGELYTSNILAAIENIIEYAQSENKPAVVNLSLGNNVGPHDGTDDYTSYLDELGKEAIICVSAGNEGNDAIVLTKEFTSSEREVQTFLYDNIGAKGNELDGYVDIWSVDNRPFTLTPCIYDTTTGEIIYKLPSVVSSTDGEMVAVSSPSYWQSGDILDEKFNQCFDGTIWYMSSVNAANNRYNAYIEVDLHGLNPSESNRYLLGLIIGGGIGLHIDAYIGGDKMVFSSYGGLSGWESGTTDGSINNMACGKNTISVGSYNTRNSYTTIGGQTGNYNTVIGQISSFSSYGTLLDGRELPHVCAPGSYLISAVSNYYLNTTGTDVNLMAAKKNINGRDNYWGLMQGTSMSSPMVAGAMALWLQADPDLTIEEARQIISETATVDDYVKNHYNPVQWGAGKFNALAGLKRVIENVGVEAVEADGGSRVLIMPSGADCFEVSVAGCPTFEVSLYNMSGVEVYRVMCNEDNALLDLNFLPAGVYVIKITGSDINYSNKVCVK